MTTEKAVTAAQNRLANAAHLSAIELLAEVTGTILGGTAAATLSLPPDISPEILGQAAFASGTGPLLGYWLETGRLAADRDVADILALHLEHSRLRATALESDVHELLAEIGPDGVAPVLIKGFHTSRDYFPEAACKPATDVDVLVSEAHAGRVRAALTNLGYVNQVAPDARYRSSWYRDDPGAIRSLDFTHCDNPRSIDLHVSLRRTVAGAVVSFPEDVDRISQPWPGFDGRVRRLKQPYLTAFLAVHACSHLRRTQLIRLVELARVIGADAGETLSWRQFDDVVASFQLGGHVFKSLSLVERLCPGTIDGGTLASLRAGSHRRLQRVVDSLSPGNVQGTHPHSLDEVLMDATGWGSTLRTLLGAALPFLPRSPGRYPQMIWKRLTLLARGRFRLRPARPEDR